MKQCPGQGHAHPLGPPSTQATSIRQKQVRPGLFSPSCASVGVKSPLLSAAPVGYWLWLSLSSYPPESLHLWLHNKLPQA